MRFRQKRAGQVVLISERRRVDVGHFSKDGAIGYGEAPKLLELMDPGALTHPRPSEPRRHGSSVRRAFIDRFTCTESGDQRPRD